MVFNLTPVKNDPGPSLVSPVPDMGNMYNRCDNTDIKLNEIMFSDESMAARQLKLYIAFLNKRPQFQ